ncbi:MAG: ADP-ribosylglycohydrolase family protein [Bryobacteraceae bacterium]|nr:ADP-ribosylglycohydrolase family protein [Bryobacteraceae bacterium]
MKCPSAVLLLLSAACTLEAAEAPRTLRLNRAAFEDKALAIWTSQIIAVTMGFPFEHKPASVLFVDHIPKHYDYAPVDDDWYYEIVMLRALEKYGPAMTLEQLGRQWLENSAGTWASAEQARVNLARGVVAPQSGHPRFNRLWLTVNHCRGDLFGMLAPGMPYLAARLARHYSHLTSYAEAADGTALVAAMVSLGFVETDPREIVKKAARVLDPASPHRQMLDEAIAMAEQGKTFHQVAGRIEDRWRIEYPASNNAVANGGIAAMALYFGGGDYLKTLNLAYSAADFTDADCNGAAAASVIAAMRGMTALPPDLVPIWKDRIVGDKLGDVPLTPPLDERISDLARRTVAQSYKVLAHHASIRAEGEVLPVGVEEPKALPPELFHPNQLTAFWDAEWTLERAGYGGPGGGVRNLRGGSFVDGEVLATYPRDEVRGLLLRRSVNLGKNAVLSLRVAADPGRAWQLTVYADNDKVLDRVIDGGPQVEWKDLPTLSYAYNDYVLASQNRKWHDIEAALGQFAGKRVLIRMFQTVLVRDKVPGNAYWRYARVESR